jgi:hypothetical protein
MIRGRFVSLLVEDWQCSDLVIVRHWPWVVPVREFSFLSGTHNLCFGVACVLLEVLFERQFWQLEV